MTDLSRLWVERAHLNKWIDDPTVTAPDEVRSAAIERVCEIDQIIADAVPETLTDMLVKCRLLAEFSDEFDDEEVLEGRLARTLLPAFERELAAAA